MTPELTYFLKINVAIALFYAFYRLFFYKDTFFPWRRVTLLCFFAISIFYPLLNIQEWIKGNEPMVAMADLYATVILPEQIIAVPQEATIDWQELLIQMIGVIYWGGVIILTVRFLIQLGSILQLHFQCKRANLQGTRMHLLKKENGPFSFFNWIFIYPEAHTDSEISEIITHEETHARQYHSADVLISEIMTIACWFNPFMWLMKREVRSNLEYMADNRVLETGHDSKSYQFHLLGLTHHKAAANLSNSFNVLPLKNRIKMMNKKRTKGIGRTKYIMLLPLAALLMIVSNIEIVARTTKEAIHQATKVIQNPILNATNDSDIQVQPANEIPNQGEETTTKISKDSIPEETVFEVVEVMPQFPGDQAGLTQYLAKNVKYPAEAMEKGEQGRVIIQFVVTKDGSVSNIKVVRSLSPSLDKEAERVIAAMPKWIPGKQNGQAVNVNYTVPVAFRLSKPSDTTDSVSITGVTDKSHLQVTPANGIVTQSEEEATTKINKDPIPEETVFEVAEEMPQFPGDQAGLTQYIAKNVKYPIEAQEKGEQGRVIIQFVVTKDGSISNIKVVRSVSPSLDKEAERIIAAMPKWIPGKQNGQAINVQFTVPVSFRLSKPNDATTKPDSVNIGQEKKV